MNTDDFDEAMFDYYFGDPQPDVDEDFYDED